MLRISPSVLTFARAAALDHGGDFSESVYLLPVDGPASTEEIFLPGSSTLEGKRIGDAIFNPANLSELSPVIDLSLTAMERIVDVQQYARGEATLIARRVVKQLASGGGATPDDLRTVGLMRKAIQERLQIMQLPFLRYSVVSPSDYDRLLAFEALLRSSPRTPDVERQIQQAYRDAARLPYGVDIAGKSIRANQSLVRKLRTTGHVLLVADLGWKYGEILMARSTEDINKAAARFSGAALAVAAGEVLSVGLGVLFGATPAGWVVLAGGLVSVAAGMYFADMPEVFVYDFLSVVNPPEPQP